MRFIRRLILKAFGIQQQIDLLYAQYDRLDSYVWSYAKFHDENGLADKDYNSETVTKHWNFYNEQNAKIKRSIRDLL